MPLFLVWHELSQVRSLPWAAQAECSSYSTAHIQAPALGPSSWHVKQTQVALLSTAWQMPVYCTSMDKMQRSSLAHLPSGESCWHTSSRKGSHGDSSEVNKDGADTSQTRALCTSVGIRHTNVGLAFLTYNHWLPAKQRHTALLL